MNRKIEEQTLLHAIDQHSEAYDRKWRVSLVHPGCYQIITIGTIGVIDMAFFTANKDSFLTSISATKSCIQILIFPI
jgi:hypothetical protein